MNVAFSFYSFFKIILLLNLNTIVQSNNSHKHIILQCNAIVMPMMPLRFYILDRKVISGKEKKMIFLIFIIVYFVHIESVTFELHFHLLVHVVVCLSSCSSVCSAAQTYLCIDIFLFILIIFTIFIFIYHLIFFYLTFSHIIYYYYHHIHQNFIFNQPE